MRRYGLIRFVSGGLLVGDEIKKTEDDTVQANDTADAKVDETSADADQDGPAPKRRRKESTPKNDDNNDSNRTDTNEDRRRRAGSHQPQADRVFANVFEELLRPEVHRVAPFWKWVGGASGTALGFIVGNIPGALAGAFAGSQLGRIRDAKGKSVAEVFMSLGAAQRAEVLTNLLQRVLNQQTRPVPQ